MSGYFSNEKQIAMKSGSGPGLGGVYYSYCPVGMSPITSVQIYHVTAVSASWKLQTSNVTKIEEIRLLDTGDTRGADRSTDTWATGSQFWYNEPSASILPSTGSANTTHVVLHAGNLGSKFVRLEIDAGGPKSNPAPAGYISTASIFWHGKD